MYIKNHTIYVGSMPAADHTSRFLIVLRAWRQLLLGWVKHQLYSHHHMDVGERKRMERGKHQMETSRYFREGKIMGP